MNLCTWSVRHPVGVVMLTLAVMVLGVFALAGLSMDLLPSLIYPEVRIRVTDPGVPATVMEDEVTRILEEQLAGTDGVVAMQSQTSEGRSAVDLSFRYGTDIDQALRDASTRLERARRLLPETIEPPSVTKRDPFQLPVVEYAVSSPWRDALELRDYVEYQLAPLLLVLPGVAAAEVGGGLQRQVTVLVDQFRLAGHRLDALDLEAELRAANRDVPAGRLLMTDGEIGGRTGGRLSSAAELADLPLTSNGTEPLARPRLGEVAEVIDGSADERLRVRLNGAPALKLSIQKQPGANTIEVVQAVARELDRLTTAGLLPADITLIKVDDQARFIRHALHNAVSAALGGALLAMLVVLLFLGSLRRTLIIGAAIPVAVLVTFILLAAFGLGFNIMTLGGLALGVGMLVDNAIVMMENMERHQRAGAAPLAAAAQAGSEVTSAMVAATATNLAAVLPFLFIGGLVGLLFRELIFTISAAILASLLIALTGVPALAARVGSRRAGPLRAAIDRVLALLAAGYAGLLGALLPWRWLVLAAFVAALVGLVPGVFGGKQEFLPTLDEGDVRVSLTADAGINLEQMDALTRQVEALIAAQPEVRSLFTTVGGFVFGRSVFERTHSAGIQVQLVPVSERDLSTRAWIGRMQGELRRTAIPGLSVTLRTQGIRGIRLGGGDDDLTLRVQGPDLVTLTALADQVVARLKQVPGLRNVAHGNEQPLQELTVRVDRDRAAALGLSVEAIGRLVRFALEGRAVTELIIDDRRVDVVVRLRREQMASPGDLAELLLFSRAEPRRAVRLGDLAQIEVTGQPETITRDRRQRILEITASLGEGLTLPAALDRALTATADLALPAGYTLYEAGSLESLQQGRDLGLTLLGLALFLVLVVLAVQYESLRNPLIIVLSAPFALVGVALGLNWTDTPLSMPVWLGLIMLAGIVVNNAIILVEFIELRRAAGDDRDTAILTAARLRLRPILMTTLTTVVGMLPLALAVGEGAEMLSPLALTIVAGLSFSTLVSLLLVPLMYRSLGRGERRAERRPPGTGRCPPPALTRNGADE